MTERDEQIAELQDQVALLRADLVRLREQITGQPGQGRPVHIHAPLLPITSTLQCRVSAR